MTAVATVRWPVVALVLALSGVWAWPAAAQSFDDALPEPAAVVTAEQADQALDEIRRVRARNDRLRRVTLAQCQTRFLVNRCADEAERQHRAAAERLRRLERHSQDIIRETRNRERNEARAEREQAAQTRIDEARQREPEGIERAQAREADREQRQRDAQAREQQAAENARRHAERERARAERAQERARQDLQRGAGVAGAPPAATK